MTAYGLLRDRTAVFLVVVAVLIGAELLFLCRVSVRHGALPFPGHGTPPREIGRLLRRYFAGVVAVFTTVVAAFLLVGWAAAAILAFALVAAGYVVYGRAYATAADAARARLA